MARHELFDRPLEQMSTARRRAAELLLKRLTKAQYRAWITSGYIPVKTAKGREIRIDRYGHVTFKTERGRLRHQWRLQQVYVAPLDRIPLEDRVLTLLLAIAADEDLFASVTCDNDWTATHTPRLQPRY